MSDVILYNEECIQAMTRIADHSINLILTDPPYNLGNFMISRDTNLKKMRDNFFGAAGWDNLEYDEWAKAMDGFFEQAARVMEKGGSMIVFMAAIKVETTISLAEKHGFYYKTTGIWHKLNPMPRNMNLHFVNSTETWIYFTYKTRTGTFNNNGAVLHDFIETAVTPASERKYGKHPTQKPEILMRHFVEVLSNDGDWVLDPFMGSGTVIEIGKSVPIYKFRKFFEAATGKALSGCEFQSWLNMQAGKTLKEAMEAYCSAVERKNMEDILSEERFNIISESDKAFILDFDAKIKRLGYDFGGGIGDGYCWGKFMIIYSKTGVKSKKVIARIFIRENDIILRLFLNGINKHITYIENAPKHIKNVFVGSHGDCSCNPKKENCRMRKTYVAENRQIEKCSGVVFEFWNPSVEKCQDYINLLEEFYPVKKPKRI